MAKYRKKPVEVEAIKFDGENAFEIYEFMGKPVILKTREDHERWDDFQGFVKEKGIKIYTLEGVMTADKGDYIIKGIKGEFYPCKPDIFEQTYDLV